MYQDQRIAVLGFGVEGQSSARYFCRHGARVVVHDQRALADLGPETDWFVQHGVTFCVGEVAFRQLEAADLVVRSPGVPLTHPGLASVPAAKLTSQTQLFLARWRDQCIGVTGTKGKGTTSTLIETILREGGYPVRLGGNIGTPVLDFIDDVGPQEWVVLELSSFQLQDVTVSPHLAVVLMIVPEHLNYHASVDEYVAAKARLVRYQTSADIAIMHATSPLVLPLAQQTAAQLQRFGATADADARITETAVWLPALDATQPLVQLAETHLRGVHNLENIAAAALVGQMVGLDRAVIATALRHYQPLPHRLERVAEGQGIVFYNDSFSTTPEAAMAALASFTEPTVMILGGSEKDSDYSALAQAVVQARQLAGLVLIGAVTARLQRALEAAGGVTCPVVTGLTTMPAMVRAAVAILDHAHMGGVVLLSPAAASFGLFHDYKDRGNQFRTAAHQFYQEAR